MTQNTTKKIKSKKPKTRFWRHALVFFVCFLIACVTWLSVMYTKEEQKALKDSAKAGVSETAEGLSFAPTANG